MSERRRSTRWALRIVVVALVVVTGFVGGRWLLHRSFFEVQHVELTGAVHESPHEVARVAGLANHPAMIDVSDQVVARRLERLAWVAHVSVERKWPSTVVIHVTERVPVAVARFNDRLYLVDDMGTRIVAVPSSRNYPLLEAQGPFRGWPFATWARPAAHVAATLPVAFKDQVATVSVNRGGDVTLGLTTPVRFELGDVDDLAAKYVAVASVIAHVALHAGDVVNVAVPGSPTVSGPSGI